MSCGSFPKRMPKRSFIFEGTGSFVSVKKHVLYVYIYIWYICTYMYCLYIYIYLPCIYIYTYHMYI